MALVFKRLGDSRARGLAVQLGQGKAGSEGPQAMLADPQPADEIDHLVFPRPLFLEKLFAPGDAQKLHSHICSRRSRV